MSHYEFSLRQEVLLEKGAGILGDIFTMSSRIKFKTRCIRSL